MNVSIRRVKPEDYGLIQGWWVVAGYNPPPLDIWPETTYIGYVGELPAMSVALYLTNSTLAWAENFIANPEIPSEQRKELVKYGLDYLAEVAKEAGAKYFWAHPNHEKLVDYYKSLGFKPLQSGLTSMARKI